MHAIILAGGLGERLRTLTDSTPKPLLKIKGKPIMQYAIENLKKHNIDDITIGISYHKEKIQDYFKDGNNLDVHIDYSIEETPLGTGGAVKQAAKDLKEPFILVWGDNLQDINWTAMIHAHKLYSAEITMALTEREDVEHFGVAELKGKQILNFIEKPKREDAPSNLINAGAFIIDPEVLKILPEGKSNIERDCFEKITKQGKVFAYIHDGQWFPTDTKEKYFEAEEKFIL